MYIDWFDMYSNFYHRHDLPSRLCETQNSSREPGVVVQAHLGQPRPALMLLPFLNLTISRMHRTQVHGHRCISIGATDITRTMPSEFLMVTSFFCTKQNPPILKSSNASGIFSSTFHLHQITYKYESISWSIASESLLPKPNSRDSEWPWPKMCTDIIPIRTRSWNDHNSLPLMRPRNTKIFTQ